MNIKNIKNKSIFDFIKSVRICGGQNMNILYCKWRVGECMDNINDQDERVT